MYLCIQYTIRIQTYGYIHRYTYVCIWRIKQYSEKDSNCIDKFSKRFRKGYYLNGDLKYPPNICNSQNNPRHLALDMLPFCNTKIIILVTKKAYNPPCKISECKCTNLFHHNNSLCHTHMHAYIQYRASHFQSYPSLLSSCMATLL